MKKGFMIDGKTLNIDLLLEYAKAKKMTPEEASVKMQMGKMYLRNRKNENKKGIYRETCTGVVESAMEAFGLNYNDLVIDLPEGYK